MEPLGNQTDQASLSRFGEEALRLLEKRDFQTLAHRFGYALAYDRDPAKAIEEKFLACIPEFESLPGHESPGSGSIAVKYFKPNNSGLHALVECVSITSEGCPLLAELIVTGKGQDKYISLEQISLAPV